MGLAKALKPESANRHVHRLYSYGWRTRTAGAFGPVLEDLNIKGATTICTAAATFGLIFGSLIGGPLGKRLIEKHSLLNTTANEDDSLLVEDEKKHERHTNMYADAVFQLILAIGVGTIFTMLLTKTGLTFDIYRSDACSRTHAKHM